MDCVVHGFAKSWTRLSDFHFTSLHCPPSSLCAKVMGMGWGGVWGWGRDPPVTTHPTRCRVYLHPTDTGVAASSPVKLWPLVYIFIERTLSVDSPCLALAQS